MLTPEEIEAAKHQLARTQSKQALSAEDRRLLKKYPRHTLEAARMIDATPLCHGIPGKRDAFYLIREQETNCLHITEDHT